ncbi:MAG TPA: hypothetical protein DEP53_07020 [Bacteroidetes bacterium]|nr:hypothetical protein [Bacteroidota bacterium]
MKAITRNRNAEHVALSKPEQDVLRVLLYFDVFGHPVNSNEIFTYFPSRVSSRAAIEGALESLLTKSFIRRRRGYYFLKTAAQHCVGERMEKQRRAVRRMTVAGLVARFISFFPFVRAVMVSGELSKGVAGPESDIDFVVVAKDGRLWVTRTLLIAFKKLFLLNSKKYFCLNHFITESNLVVESRNFYSALEMATLKPLVNRRLHAEYVTANEWIREYFPNHGELTADGERTAPPLIRSFLEKLFPANFTDRAEEFLMARWQIVWNRRYAHLTEADRRHRFRCMPGISTAYGEDFQHRVLTKYAYRLQQYGLPPIGHAN